MNATTIPELLRARSQDMPDAPAVIGRLGGSWTTISYRELDELSDRVAGGLLSRQVAPGAAVAWGLDNSAGAEALILHHAIVKVGAVSVPLNTRLVGREVAAMAAQTEAVLLVADLALGGRWGHVPVDTIWRADAAGDDVVSLLGRAGTHRPPDPDPEALACVLYTSGTTGLPKGVEHTHRSALAAGLGWSEALGYTPDDRVQSPFPIFSGAGLHFNALAAMWAGASFVVDETDVGASLDRVGQYRTTVYVAVPAIYQYWLDRPHLGAADLGSLRLLVFGGSAMAAPVIERLQAAVPTASLMHTYGLTEAGPSGTYLPSALTLAKLGSIGDRAAGASNRFRVIDGDGQDVGPGGVGELVFAGPSVMRGYHLDPAATASVFIGEWLRSGDRVRLDADGFLFYEGRFKDLVVRGGYNISPLEVERVLMDHPTVLDAAVFGVPHPRLGEEVAAAIVVRHDAALDLDDIRRHCAEHLSDLKVPRTYDVLDELPRNAAGKVLKRDLAARHPLPPSQSEGPPT